MARNCVLSEDDEAAHLEGPPRGQRGRVVPFGHVW